MREVLPAEMCRSLVRSEASVSSGRVARPQLFAEAAGKPRLIVSVLVRGFL